MDKMKRLKIALWILRLMYLGAITAILAGFGGIVVAAGRLSEASIGWPVYLLTSACCITVLFLGGWLWDTAHDLSPLVQKQIRRLRRRQNASSASGPVSKA